MKKLLVIILISMLASCATGMYGYRKCPTNDKRYFYRMEGRYKK
jgi:uncharacterized protein YxeA